MLLEIFTEVITDIQAEIPAVKKAAFYKDEFRNNEWKPVFPVVFVRYDGTKPINETKNSDGSFSKSRIILSVFAGDKDTTAPKTLQLVEKLENLFNANELSVVINSVTHRFPTYLTTTGTDFVTYVKGLTVYRVQVEIEVPTGLLPADDGELPAAPTLLTPLNGATDVNAAHPALTWDGAADDLDYTVIVSSNSGFTNIIFQETYHAYESIVIPDGIISNSSTYYWKVRARNAVGYGEFSAARSFTTASGVSYDADLTAWLAKITGTQPTTGRKDLLNTFIAGLKTDGIFQKLDSLWILAAETAEHAQLNFIQNKGSIVPMNSMTFTADRGYTGNGTNMYLRTNTSPKYSYNYSQNNACFGLYVNTNVNEAGQSVDMGVSYGSNCLLYTRFGGQTYTCINDAGSTPNIASTNSIGFYAVDRNSSAQFRVYKNGSLIQTNSFNSTGVTDFEFTIGARNNVGVADRFAAKRYALAFVGKGMTATEHANFYSRVNTLLTAIGAN